MRKLYKPNSPLDKKSILSSAKHMAIEHNVTLNVIDLKEDKIVQSHTSHNAATNSLLTGIGHYLVGDGVFNQGYEMLSRFVPRYISLGTMGLISQECDDEGLPTGLGGIDDTINKPSGYEYNWETQRICHYASECPGFGADGYSSNENNGRPYFGLGPTYDRRLSPKTINCELISDSYVRSEISFRDIVPEYEAEIPKTIDIIFSAMIGTGALSSFREPGKDYIFITEAGLWSKRQFSEGGDNGLLAGYRIVPPNQDNWDFGTFVEGEWGEDGVEVTPDHYIFDDDNPDDPTHGDRQRENQKILKENILRVGRNQVVQVIWKIQLGGLEQLGGMSELYPSMTNGLIWEFWD